MYIFDFSQIGLPPFSLGLDLLCCVISLGIKGLSAKFSWQLLLICLSFHLALSGQSTEATAKSSFVVSRIISDMLCYSKQTHDLFSLTYLGAMLRKRDRLSA